VRQTGTFREEARHSVCLAILFSFLSSFSIDIDCVSAIPLTVTRMALFRRRSAHALLILGNLIYLQFCIRALQGLVCTSDGRLLVETSTICYSGSHAYVVISRNHVDSVLLLSLDN
jgi:hypothetical protein